MIEEDLVKYLLGKGYKLDISNINYLRFFKTGYEEGSEYISEDGVPIDYFDEIRIECDRITRDYYFGGEHSKEEMIDEDINDLEIYNGMLIKILLP